jgi:nicotinamidase-related amidase
MPARNQDLHGSAPDKSSVALLIIDLIGDFDFEGGEVLLEQALPMARAIRALKARAREARIPVIYVNDNYGRWQSDLDKLIANATRPDSPGRELVELLIPDEADYFVLKPKHSAFYSTILDTLLDYLGTRTLIVTGVAADMCVLFSASDAYIRDFFVAVPEDCVACADPDNTRSALRLMHRVLKADTTPSAKLDLEALKRRGEGEGSSGS